LPITSYRGKLTGRFDATPLQKYDLASTTVEVGLVVPLGKDEKKLHDLPYSEVYSKLDPAKFGLN